MIWRDPASTSSHHSHLSHHSHNRMPNIKNLCYGLSKKKFAHIIFAIFSSLFVPHFVQLCYFMFAHFHFLLFPHVLQCSFNFHWSHFFQSKLNFHFDLTASFFTRILPTLKEKLEIIFFCQNKIMPTIWKLT
jgi:hypothetical protein